MTSIPARLRSGEALAYAVLTLLGVAAVVRGLAYGALLPGNRVGPGFLPAVMGGLVALLCAMVLVRMARERPQEHHDGVPVVAAQLGLDESDRLDGLDGRGGDAGLDGRGGDAEADDDIDITGRDGAQRLRILRVVFAVMFVTLLLVPLVGFLAAFGLMILVISTMVEHQRLGPSLLITAASVAVIYVVFGVFLHVPLPGGLLGLGTEG